MRLRREGRQIGLFCLKSLKIYINPEIAISQYSRDILISSWSRYRIYIVRVLYRLSLLASLAFLATDQITQVVMSPKISLRIISFVFGILFDAILNMRLGKSGT